jgi:hypothetical protein
MSEFTYDEELFSDFYKEVNGVRPRGHNFYTAEPAVKQAMWDQLMQEHEAEMERYYAAQNEGVARFEAKVLEMIEIGAPDREAAIRWLEQGVSGGKDYLEYAFNLPYGYLLHEQKA